MSSKQWVQPKPKNKFVVRRISPMSGKALENLLDKAHAEGLNFAGFSDPQTIIFMRNTPIENIAIDGYVLCGHCRSNVRLVSLGRMVCPACHKAQDVALCINPANDDVAILPH